MQRLFGTDPCAFVAENALRSVFPLAGFSIDLHIHGADPQTFAAVNALILITVNAQQREITHGFEKHCDRTQILAECPVVPERECQRNACDVVKRISCKKQPKHNFFKICNFHQKQPGYQCQGQSEHHIAQNTKLFLPG